MTEYLDPRRRVLQSYQIGLSAHKNSYSNKVLVSNYYEERAYNPNEKPQSTKFDAQSTMKDSFKHHAPENVSRRDMIVREDLGQDSLFKHQRGPKSRFVTTNDLTYTKGDVDFHNTRTDALLTGAKGEPEAPSRTSLLEKKRRQWQQERDEVLNDVGTTFNTTYLEQSRKAMTPKQ